MSVICIFVFVICLINLRKRRPDNERWFLLGYKGKRRAESGNGAVFGDEESGRVWGKERRAVVAEDKEDGGKNIGGKTDVRIRVGQSEDRAGGAVF